MSTAASASSAGQAKAQSGCCGGGLKAPLAALTREQILELPLMELIARYRRGIEAIDRRVFDLTEKQIDTAFLPEAGVGRWPVRVLIGHIADAELSYTHRMRRAFAEESPVVAVWDENAFVDSNIYGNADKAYAGDPEADEARVMHALGGNLAVIHTLRQWTAHWLMTLPEKAWDRAVMHPERGSVSIRRMAAMMTWHLEHHADFLRRKLDLMVGPAKAEASEEGGECCGGSGGCCGGKK